MGRSADGAFIGRVAELADLRAALDAARAGRPQIAVVEGESGMGKTTLLRRFAAGLTRERLVWASGDQTEMTLPYGVANQLVAGLPTPLPAVDTSSDHFAVGARLLAGISALEASSAAVVVVDDLQWIDLPSSRALLFCLRRLRVDEVLVLVTSPPRGRGLDRLDLGWTHLLTDHDVTRRIPLGGLTATEVGAVAGGSGLTMSPAAQEHVRAHTLGNPLYVTALLAELPDSTLRDEVARLPAPRAFAATVLARLSRLPAGARELVAAAAVLGLRCPLQLAESVAHTGEPERSAEQAVQAGLLTVTVSTGGEVLEFDHLLVRTAIYDDLSPLHRQRLHRAAAGVVAPPESYRHRAAAAAAGGDSALALELRERAHEERAVDSFAQATTYLLSASVVDGDRERAALSLFEAVELAVFSGDFAAARGHAEAVLACPESDARAHARALLEIADGRLARASGTLQVLVEEHGEQDDFGVRCVAARSLVAAMSGDGAATVHWATRARQGAAHLPDVAAFASQELAWGYGRAGLLGEALAAVADASPLHRRPDAFEADTLAVRGIMRSWAGQLTVAREELQAVVRWVQGGAGVRYVSYVYATLAEVEFLLGRWDAAAAHVELATSLGHDLGHPWFLPYAHCVAAQLYAAVGQDALAQENAEAARRVAPLGGTPDCFGYAALAQAHCAAGMWDWARVIRVLAPLQDAPDAIVHEHPNLGRWRHVLVEAYLAEGRVDSARTLLARIDARPASSVDAPTRARLGALSQQAAGEITEAADAFGAAFAAVGEGSRSVADGLLALDYGRFLLQSGHRRKARQPLMVATDIFARLGATPMLHEGERALAAAGVGDGSGAPHQQSVLTAREQVVATMVSTGMTNREVAAELYLSVKAVEYHLGNIFSKLGIRSRRQLRSGVAPGGRTVSPAGPRGEFPHPAR